MSAPLPSYSFPSPPLPPQDGDPVTTLRYDSFLLHYPHTKRATLVELGSSVHVESGGGEDFIGVVEDVMTEVPMR